MAVFYNREDVVKYFEIERVSQHYLKAILSGMEIFNKEDDKKLYFEESESFLMGSAVDTFMTEGNDVFNEKYIVMEMPKPSAAMKSVVNILFDKYKARNEGKVLSNAIFAVDVPVSDIHDACAMEGYLQSMKEETRLEKVKKEGQDYFHALAISYGKEILSSEEYAKAKAIIDSFLKFPEFRFLSKDYVEQHPDEFEDLDIYYQFPIYWEIDGILCKGLIDVLVVDHKNKKIIPYDCKTTSEYTKNFINPLRRFRYDIQGAFYTEGLHLQKSDSWRKLFTEGYSIDNFTFVVESTKAPGNPLMFIMDNELLRIGRDGRMTSQIHADTGYAINIRNNKIEKYYGQFKAPVKMMETIRFPEISGFMQALRLHEWYVVHGFKIDKDIVESNRKFTINWNGIVQK